jgi:hypothetical protein
MGGVIPRMTFWAEPLQVDKGFFWPTFSQKLEEKCDSKSLKMVILQKKKKKKGVC